MCSSDLSFGATYKPSDVFRDFVELAALAIFNSYMRDDDWEIREERYHTIRREYKEEAFKIFPELLGVLASGCIRAVNVGSYEDFRTLRQPLPNDVLPVTFSVALRCRSSL